MRFGLLSTALLVLGSIAPAACAKQEVKPPDDRNLVLISIDTLVPDRMSTYGAERPTTPAIDALAARAVRFENAFSPSPWTLPAHASMLTGYYPSSLADDPTDRGLYRVAPMLAERLQRAGFRTAAFVGGGYVSTFFGVERGFESLRQPPFPARDDAYVEGSAKEAAGWIERHRDERFFLFFHTFAAHAPYDDARFLDVPVPRHLRNLRPAFLCRTLHPAEVDVVETMYDGGVARADALVGEILRALEETGLDDRTVVVVTSDHGQEFWSHTDRGGHAHSLYRNLLRVPLIWYEPGLAPSARTVDAAVGLVDLVPTLLARLDVAGGGGMDGIDISPLLEGRPAPRERPLFGEGVDIGPRRYSVRSPRAKLIVTPEPEVQRGLGEGCPVPVRAQHELYLADDTAEQRNVAELPRFQRLLDEHLGLLAAHREAGAETPSPPPLPDLPPGLERQLRDLGYVE